MIGLVLALGFLILILHAVAVCLSWALRTYSPSRLEEVCTARQIPERAEQIEHNDEHTERSAEALATLTGLSLAALLGAGVALRVPWLAFEAILFIALLIAAVGHIGAGIAGRVHAEEVLATLWPATGALRAAMAPLTGPTRFIETFAYSRTANSAVVGPRPASVEVEFEPEGDEAEKDGEIALSESTHEMLERAIELSRRDVHELMTPRSALCVLPATVTAEEAAQAFIDSGYSRIPLYGENRDDIVGILYTKDLFARLLAQRQSDPGGPAVSPRALSRPPLYVPESKNAAELLEEFRTRRVQMAIVLDEYGGVAGLVSLEDLLEELVGEIVDEHDIPSPDEPVVQVSDSRYEVDATLTIEDLNERLGLRLPTDEDFSTVGGLAFSTLGHLPEPGTTFQRNGVEFTVLRVEGRSIRRLGLNLHPAETVNHGQSP